MNTKYRVYISRRNRKAVRDMIKLNPDVVLPIESYTDDGFVTTDINQARLLKRSLQSCIDYAFQTERVARRNSLGRHQTDKLANEWVDVRAVIEPDPDASRLMR